MPDWTKKEEKKLLDGVGSFGWSTLVRRTGGRSKGAIIKKIKREFGGGGITRGTYTLQQVMDETSYSRTQLQRAAQSLGQRWNRTAKGKNHPFLITGEQLEELVIWLSHDYWSKALSLYGCVNCGTDQEDHYTFGCCLRCYKTLRRIASSRQLPFTAKSLLEVLDGHELDPELQRIHHNLTAGRAPNCQQLEALWTFEKPSVPRQH